MKLKYFALVSTAACSLFTATNIARAQGTAFTYQGRLNDANGPASGSYDMRFTLFATKTTGVAVAGPVTNSATAVTNGLFTATINFGPGVFTGGSNWLDIAVRTNGAGTFTGLTPRQQVTPTPYALFAENANAANLVGPVLAANLSGVSGSGLTGVGLLAGGNTFSGNQTIDGSLDIYDGTGPSVFTDLTIGPSDYYVGEQHSINYDYTGGHIGSLTMSYNGSVGFFSVGNFYYNDIGHPGTAAFNVWGNGNVNVDPNDLNDGFLNNGSTNGSGLTFGSGSGEGIASKRTAGGNLYGLDFYTEFNDRMSIAQNGQVTILGEYLVVNGLTPVYAYIGDDGAGNDVQIGSQKSGVTAVAAYNTADQAYMHLYCSSITIEGGSDLAEPFKITAGNEAVSPGAVVVIDEQNPGHLKISDQSYDPHVAGVVSGANGINPGIQMQQQGVLDGGKNVALTGRVYVRTDTSNGAIKPGDLLTTSSIPGDAMKVTDHARAVGAILGKAMTGLSEGNGLVLVLVTLQ